MNFLESLKLRVRKKNPVVAFPDATDVRTLRAVNIMISEGILRPILIGSKQQITLVAMDNDIQLDDSIILSPDTSDKLNDFSQEYYELRQHKGITIDQAKNEVQNPLIFAGMLLRNSFCSAVVAGSLSTTGDVIRAGITTIGTQSGVSTVSSFFAMILTDERVLWFSDCGVVPYPTQQQLCDIAYSSAISFKTLTGEEPRVAFLSFSTKGSAEHESVQKVRGAFELFRQSYPDILADGELQVDSAIIESIAERKAKDSPVAGKANVLVFPNLDAGNIGYKLTERLAGAIALGPIIQGLAKPYCDLSRGCSVDDIVNVACISVLMDNENQM
jgi:phosphate acetyltransferase